MSDQQLLEKIIESVTREKDPISEKIILKNDFIEITEDSEIVNLWETSDYNANGLYWHQIARLALKQAADQQFMFAKLWGLLETYRGNFKDYFILETELGRYPIPNPLIELNRLVSLYHEFFVIYNNISHRIHFDFPKKQYFGPLFRGMINWEKTIRMSTTEFPLNFASEIPERKFDTPGNILLVLCTLWMHRECSRILQLNFPEPLDDEKKQILENISGKTKNILLNFPFQDVLKSSIKYWKLPNDDKNIFRLEKQLQKNIQLGINRNPNYVKLLEWIYKFRNLNLNLVSKETPVKNLLKAQVAQDTIFEAWIFFEFLDFFEHSGYHPILHMEKTPYYFEFDYKGETVLFYYEKFFKIRDRPQYVWAINQKPDFSVMVGDELLGVFDAKNYSKGQDPDEAVNKMLSYMNNFNTDFGVLFFPYLPKLWNEMFKNERKNELNTMYAKENPQLTENEIKDIPKPEARKSWENLDPKLKKIFRPNSVKHIVNPKKKTMKFYFMRMEPNDSPTALEMKDQTIEAIFDEIRQKLDRRKNEPAMELAS